MNRAEMWTIVGVCLTTVLLNFAVTEYVVRGSIADVRVEMAGLKAGLTAEASALSQRFDDASSRIEGIVASGMQERTDELSRALLAEQPPPDWVVRVANLAPGSPLAAQFEDISSLDGIQAIGMMLGGKLNYEFRLRDLDGAGAAAIQAAWDQASESPALIEVYPSGGAAAAVRWSEKPLLDVPEE